MTCSDWLCAAGVAIFFGAVVALHLARRSRPELRWLTVPMALAGLLCATLLVHGLAAGEGAGGEPPRIERTVPAAAQRTKALSVAEIKAVMQRLRPLHRALAPVHPGDWLAHHREPGETFAQYLKAHPAGPDRRRRIIYVQPIGEFSASQRKALDVAADFMARYFCLPVKVTERLPLSVIPPHAKRVHPSWGDHQLLTTYILDRVLKPRLPRDAVSYLGLTASDLWPGRGWNFVFGQASLDERVGVWSIYRNGDPEGGPQSFRLFMLRTLKTAVHETGHMLSMQHCTAYECNMCGSNSRVEADRRPIALCPECLGKLLWATSCDPVARYRGLAELCARHGLKAEEQLYRRLLQAAGPI